MNNQERPAAGSVASYRSKSIMNYLLRDIYDGVVRIVDCMPALESAKRRVVDTLRQPTYLAAAVAVFIAAASVGYGLTNDDLLTALGAFLILPSIVLLYRIGSRGDVDVKTGRQRQAN